MTCRVCGRPIHDPLSISRGIGPVCYERDRIQLRLDFELFEEEPPVQSIGDIPVADHILPPRLTFWQRLVRWLGL